MNNDFENEREKLLLHSLTDVVKEEKQKTQNLQSAVLNLENTMPTKTSDLTNDSDFVTENDLQNLGEVVDQISDDVSTLQLTINNLGGINMNTENLENGIDELNSTNSNINTTIGNKLQALTVAVRGIGADFTQVDATVSDVKSGKKFFDDEGILQTGTIPTYSGNTTITQNRTVETANKFMASDLTVAVPRPQLNAPTISLTDDTLSITNPNTNGNFVESYKIYANNSCICTTANSTVDLSDYITHDGTYTITATCYSNSCIESAQSQSVSYIVQNVIYTNVTDITNFLTDYQTEDDFNTSTSEKLQFGTLLGNTPCATIWFRQKSINLTDEQIELQFFITGLSNPASIPALIKLNNTTAFSGNLTLVSGESYLATCTIHLATNISFNELTVEFTDATQANAYLDYINIAITGTQNCIILNRDTSFELAGLKRTSGNLLEYSRKYVNGGGNKWCGGENQDFTTALHENIFSFTTVQNEIPRYIHKYLLQYRNLNDNIMYFVLGGEIYCYITQQNNLVLLYSSSSYNVLTATNVCYAKKSLFNGAITSNNLYAFTKFDGSAQLVFFNPNANYEISDCTQCQTWNFSINSTNLPNEFVDVIPVQDYYPSNRNAGHTNGYFFLHKSGNILFLPDVNSTYFLKIGKGKQINAFASADGLTIHVYFSIDNTVYRKKLTRTSTTSTTWNLEDELLSYNNYKEIRERATIGIAKNSSLQLVPFTLDT